MKSEPYNCPSCGKPDEIRSSLWQRLGKRFAWQCPHCEEHLSSTIHHRSNYYFCLFAFIAVFLLTTHLTDPYLRDVFPQYFYIGLLGKILIDCAFSSQREIRQEKSPVLSRFEKEELSDDQL